MPLYFTHLYQSDVLCDQRGEEFESVAKARAAALASAGELIAEQITEGRIVDLAHRLEVMDQDGQVVIILTFAELFKGAGTAPPDAQTSI